MRRLLWIAAVELAAFGRATVHYGVEFEPDLKQAHVAIRLDSSGASETFRIPAWSPGYYQIARYQDGISEVVAKTADGERLRIQKDGMRGWHVANPEKKPFTLSYQVEGNDQGLGFFATEVDKHHGFVNGASALMYVDGRKTEDALLKVSTPQGWDTAVPLPIDSSGEYPAGGYDELIDSPIQSGVFSRHTFTAKGIPFQVIYVSPDDAPAANLDDETDRFSKLVVPAINLFGSTPFKAYTFVIHLAPGSFSGGLEHRASTVIDTLNTKPLQMDDLITHEFFHSWNIKNIRPACLGPFDLTREVRTDNLWFGEGVTDYYAKLTAYESGLQNATWLFTAFSEELANLQQSRSRLKYTLAQASRGAWEGGSEGIGDLSYYNKGQLVGMILDAEIRKATEGAKSLDDVMRLLYERHRLPQPGYAEDEIKETVNEVAGVDLSASYDAMVYSTKELPYDELSAIGIRVAPKGVPVRDPGFRLDETGRVIFINEANKSQGVRVGDLVSLESIKGEEAKFKVDREHETFHITVPVRWQTSDDTRLEFDPFATAAQRLRRAEWLHR
jgi:predicted metalloprotease with PDZ domain